MSHIKLDSDGIESRNIKHPTLLLSKLRDNIKTHSINTLKSTAWVQILFLPFISCVTLR